MFGRFLNHDIRIYHEISGDISGIPDKKFRWGCPKQPIPQNVVGSRLERRYQDQALREMLEREVCLEATLVDHNYSADNGGQK